MSVVTTEPRAAERGVPRWKRAHTQRVIQIAGALVALHLTYQAWSTYGAWFHIDDFNFVSRMTNDGLSLTTASRSYFGHVMPAAMYLSWLNNGVAPWNWFLPATELLLMQALADIGLLVLLVRLFGMRLGILAPFSVYLFSAISMPVSIWWAAAINQIPLMISLFFGLAAHTAYLRTGRLRHAFAATAWIAVGLAFNEKTILVYGAIGIITLCYFASGSISQRLTMTVRVHGRGLALYVVVAVAYVALYLRIGLDFSPGQRIGYPTFQVVQNMLFRAYLPGVLGGPLQWWRIPDQPGSIPSPGDLVVVVSVVVFGLLLRELHRTRTRWARAALLPAFFLTVDVVLVLTGRASYVGSLISLDYRYQGELAAVSAIALGCALFPILGATQTVSVRAPSELFDFPQRSVVACLVVSALGVYSSSAYVRHWHADHKAEAYVQRVVSTLERATTAIPLVDAPVPPSVTNGLRYPENEFSHVFRDYDQATAFPPVATDHLYVVGETGTVTPAAIPPTRSAPPGPKKRCGYRISGQARTIALDGPVAYGGWWIRIGYIGTASSPVKITSGDITRYTSVQPGVHALFVKGGGSFDSVRISGLQGDASLCTDDVTVGRPEPTNAVPQ